MTFRTLLVANRGEIASRILHSARARGLRTVAVHSDADAGARHVGMADMAVRLGPAAPARSYLSVEAILDAARRTGAEAVHPGYGFLAENAGFAEACRDAGLVFVGPAVETIRTMGDKALAKAAMAEAGLPVIPGTEAGADQSDDAMMAAAGEVGFPLMVKAVAGGGGRGMRRVEAAHALPEALRAARAEARGAFGDDRLLLERAVDHARHVEVQVFGDRHGAAIHLGERDCSVQRRNQKLIEEAPSPVVDAALRERMGRASADAARAISYEGAGTIEFLLDDDGAFWFMEMNTRLQVEHPVTEALTGLDLVDWQLRVAAGEPLPLCQDEIRLEGHAIEARLCAEDDAFVPQAGRLALWRPAPGLRVDAGVEDGAEVPPDYDSLLAKLVAHGPDRAGARRILLWGLRETVALGVATNAGLLARCLEHPAFVAGEVRTGFVEAEADALAPLPLSPRRRLLLAAMLRATAPGSGHAEAARAPGPTFDVPMAMEAGGARHEVRLAPERDGALVATNADDTLSLRLHLLAWDGRDAEVELDGVRVAIPAARDGDRLALHWEGRASEATDLSLRAARTGGGVAGDVLRAPMSGRVAAVHAGVGDAVEAGTTLVVVEAMKMEHELRLPVAGTVAEISVVEGAQVTGGQVLLRIDPESSDRSSDDFVDGSGSSGIS